MARPYFRWRPSSRRRDGGPARRLRNPGYPEAAKRNDDDGLLLLFYLSLLFKSQPAQGQSYISDVAVHLGKATFPMPSKRARGRLLFRCLAGGQSYIYHARDRPKATFPMPPAGSKLHFRCSGKASNLKKPGVKLFWLSCCCLSCYNAGKCRNTPTQNLTPRRSRSFV
jgi:hypothetical protein